MLQGTPDTARQKICGSLSAFHFETYAVFVSDKKHTARNVLSKAPIQYDSFSSLPQIDLLYFMVRNTTDWKVDAHYKSMLFQFHAIDRDKRSVLEGY